MDMILILNVLTTLHCLYFELMTEIYHLSKYLKDQRTVQTTQYSFCKYMWGYWGSLGCVCACLTK